MFWLKYLEKYLTDKVTYYYDYFHITFANANFKPVFLGGFDPEARVCVCTGRCETEILFHGWLILTDETAEWCGGVLRPPVSVLKQCRKLFG